MIEEVSMREFARRDGCSHTLVQKAVQRGNLTLLANEKLDAALVGTDWRPSGRPKPLASMPSPLPEPLQGETLAETARRLLGADGAMRSRPEAERVKENYLALLRQLEFETKSRAVLPLADVELACDQAVQTFRLGLEALPGRLSAELAGITNPAIVKDRLAHECNRILQGCADRFERLAEAHGQDGEGSASAPEADGGPVGERRPRAAARNRRARPVPE